MTSSKNPISLCLIVKNEPLLERALLSIKDFVSEIVIIDTGSTDQHTIDVSKKYATYWEQYLECNNPETGVIEDFSKARNYSFSKATQPWVLWMDADDEIFNAHNLSKLLEIHKQKYMHYNGFSYVFPYEYAYNEQGQCTCKHYRERLVYNPKLFSWKNPVHEVLVPKEGFVIFFEESDDVLYKHNRQLNEKIQEPGRNLRILKKYFEKNPDDSDPRNYYYYGLECVNSGLVEDGVKSLSKYVDISGWEDERAMACLKLGDIFIAQGNYEQALKWGFKTIEIKETWGEGYFLIAKCFYFLAQKQNPNTYRNWEKCVFYAEAGLNLRPTKTLLFINPLERDHEIHLYFNVALNAIGRTQEALKSIEVGLKAKPKDTNLLHNKKLYETYLIKQKALEFINQLNSLEYFEEKNYKLICMLLNKEQSFTSFNEIKPDESKIKDEKQFEKEALIKLKEEQDKKSKEFLLKKFEEDKKEEIKMIKYGKQEVVSDKSKLDIIFFAGDGLETWTPETVKQTGIGGSELMLMQQAKELAALGHTVRVYNSCGNLSGRYDSVSYLKTEEYHDTSCDVLVISRRTDMIHDKYNVKAKLKFLWVHDVWAMNATNELLLKFDRIFALTQWHKENLIKVHNLHPDHIIVTRNGIYTERFKEALFRDQYKCVNFSSPDRSWPVLLDIWPEIKKHVPQASLTLGYGFKNWEIVSKLYNDQNQLNLIDNLKNRLKELESLDVRFLDRINQEELTKELLTAGVCTYPTWFSETSGISLMEAQAAGLRIVTSPIAALNETVADRGVLIPGEWTSIEYKNAFIDATIKALNTTGNQDRIKLQNYAKNNFDIIALAKEWNNLFYDLIDLVKKNPIVPYEPTGNYKSFKVNKESIVKLNIGAGPNVFPFDGWINYDKENIDAYIDFLNIDHNTTYQTAYYFYPQYQKDLIQYVKNGGKIDFRIQDLTSGFPQHKDNTVDVIYFGQAIEHCNYFTQVPNFLKECHRMLKPNGVLRITTPDIDLLINDYVNHNMEKYNDEQPAFYKDLDNSGKLSMIMFGAAGPNCTQSNYEGHMFLFNKATMEKALKKAGFKEVIFYNELHQSKSEILAKECQDFGFSHSMIVEAIK